MLIYKYLWCYLPMGLAGVLFWLVAVHNACGAAPPPSAVQKRHVRHCLVSHNVLHVMSSLNQSSVAASVAGAGADFLVRFQTFLALVDLLLINIGLFDLICSHACKNIMYYLVGYNKRPAEARPNTHQRTEATPTLLIFYGMWRMYV